MNETTNNRKPKKTPTHDLFDVQDREGKTPFWNKVGAIFENRDGSHSVLIYQPGLPDPKTLQLRAIDRNKRPLKDGADPARSPTHELFVIIEVENAPNEWRRVGVAFTNREGSLSLVVDDGNREGPKARFQMRTHKVTPLRSTRRQDQASTEDGGETPEQPASPADDTPSGAEQPRPRTTIRKSSSSAA